eukprot:scaffold98745_cov36-Cyclotella_meneghiniana.AAC.2
MSELSHAAIPLNNHINLHRRHLSGRRCIDAHHSCLHCIIIDTETKQANSRDDGTGESGLSVVLSQVREVEEDKNRIVAFALRSSHPHQARSFDC